MILASTTFVQLGYAASPAADGPVYDIVVYGDSSGAVTAAIAAKREGRSVILVNPDRFLGGMSSSGLGATDFGGDAASLVVSPRSFTKRSPRPTERILFAALNLTLANESLRK